MTSTYDPTLADKLIRFESGPRAQTEQPLPYLDMSGWDSNPAPEREWAVDNRIPMYQPHLTTGHGAIGKSLLELTRAVAHVLGKPWLGMAVRQGPVIYLGAEDEEDELHRRLEAILRHYGAKFGDIVGGLHLLSYVGEDCLLGIPDNKDIIRPTELFHRLLVDAIRIGPVSVTIDTLTDVYAGDEIDRNQTTQFVKLLQHMAIKARCSVAILAHPSNAGMATGSGLSGSTGWHNKVRSREGLRPKGVHGRKGQYWPQTVRARHGAAIRAQGNSRRGSRARLSGLVTHRAGRERIILSLKHPLLGLFRKALF
jgi:RecA-family ATPase